VVSSGRRAKRNVSELKVANAAVIADARHRAGQVDDHESRLRSLESGNAGQNHDTRIAHLESADYVTHADLEARDASFRDDSARRESRRLAALGLIFVAIQVIEGGLVIVFR
jgi:hypothetical protein